LLTGRHAIRSGTQTVDVTGGPDGMTRWEVTSAQALSDAGYATGMWGKWHLGSDPEQRSPVDFGFDEAVWSPRTADEVFWTMQSYFPNAPVTATPYAGPAQIPLTPEPIYARKKGERAEVISAYDAEFRAGFDRKITEWASDFMTRSAEVDQPFYVYLPYTHVHIPPIPDPEYAGKTKRGNWADLLRTAGCAGAGAPSAGRVVNQADGGCATSADVSAMPRSDPERHESKVPKNGWSFCARALIHAQLHPR
jgi:arylsulfatase A-like enzyme